MRKNTLGQIARNHAGAAVATSWLDDETELFQAPLDAAKDTWHIVTRKGGIVTTYPAPHAWSAGANDIVARDGEWVRRLDSGTPPCVGSQPWIPGHGRVGDVDFGGSVLVISDDGLTMHVDGKPIARTEVQGYTRLIHGLLSYTASGQVRVYDVLSDKALAVTQVGPGAAKVIAFRVDGAIWLAYQTDAHGGVVHRIDDASQGYRYGTPQKIYEPEVHVMTGGGQLDWSSDEGQMVQPPPLIVEQFGVGMVQLTPIVPPPIVPPPVDDAIGPRSAPAPDGFEMNLAPFFEYHAQYWPRGSASPADAHSMDLQMLTHAAGEDARFAFIKFGDEGKGARHEVKCIAGGYVHALLDASNEPVVSFPADTRQWKLKTKVGRAFALQTIEHEIVEMHRSGCTEFNRWPFVREQWLQSYWPAYYWGKDICEQPTALCIYNPTGGVVGPGRYVEGFYYAGKASWAMWKSWPSEEVWPSGDMSEPPIFAESPNVQTSNFIFLGGQRWPFAPTGCAAAFAIPASFPEVTIIDYATSVTEGKPAKAIAKITGEATRIEWLYRALGSSAWLLAVDNPADDPDHSYYLPTGQWEIGARVQPGGHQTGKQRIVTVITAVPVQPPAVGNGILVAGQRIGTTPFYSQDKRFNLVVQADGDLVKLGPQGWKHSLFDGRLKGLPVGTVDMQGDGNFVAYASDGTLQKDALGPIASGTNGHTGAYLAMQNDGHAVIYGPGVLWTDGVGPYVPLPPEPGKPGQAEIYTNFLGIDPSATFALQQAYFDAPERARRIALHTERAYNYLFVLAREGGDSPEIDLYADVPRALTVIEEIRSAGLKTMLWLMPETASVATERTVEEWITKFKSLVASVDAVVDSYCVGLELEENFSEAEVGQMADALRGMTTKPIWVHGGQGVYWGRSWFEAHSSVTGLLYQYPHPSLPGGGFLATPDVVQRETAALAWELHQIGRTFVACEYGVSDSTDITAELNTLATIAMQHGSQGFANGGPVGVTPLLPAPSPAIDEIDPATITWMETCSADVSGWAVTSRLEHVTIEGGYTVCLDHTKAGVWPTVRWGDTNETEEDFEGNPLIVALLDGKWYGAAWDWFGVGKTCKGITPIEFGRDQIRQSPLDASWPGPQSGDMVGWLVAAPCSNRIGLRSVLERSNIVLARWP
jgi:hypothetical protein